MPVSRESKPTASTISSYSSTSTFTTPTTSSRPVSTSNLESVMALASSPSDFVTVSGLTERHNVFIAGDEGTGKTGLVLRHCPQPIALIGGDDRAREEVEKAARRGDQFKYANLEWSRLGNYNEDGMKAYARDVKERVLHHLRVAVAQSILGQVKTICLDFGTEMATLIDLAYDGKQERGNVFGKDSHYRKASWWEIFEIVGSGKAHFVVTCRARAEVKDELPTKQITYDGHKVIGQASHIGVAVTLDPDGFRGVSRANIDFETLQTIQIIKAGRDGKGYKVCYTKADWKENGWFAHVLYEQNKELFPNMTPQDWRMGKGL